MANLAVEVRNVSKTYRSKQSEIVALEDASFDAAEGEFVTIIGPSGCGKSTLLNILAGLVKLTQGEVKIFGEIVNTPKPKEIAIMFQDYTLYPWRTVIKNVEFGLELRGLPKQERKSRAMEYIKLVGLSGFEDKYPSELSGGMKQRVSLARSLSLEPKVLLMDEPFGALDEQTRIIMGDELIKIWEKTKKTIVLVTHSLIEAAYLSDKVVVMSARPGRIKSIFRVEAVRPRDPNSHELTDLRAKIWENLKEESMKMVYGK